MGEEKISKYNEIKSMLLDSSKSNLRLLGVYVGIFFVFHLIVFPLWETAVAEVKKFQVRSAINEESMTSFLGTLVDDAIEVSDIQFSRGWVYGGKFSFFNNGGGGLFEIPRDRFEMHIKSPASPALLKAPPWKTRCRDTRYEPGPDIKLYCSFESSDDLKLLPSGFEEAVMLGWKIHGHNQLLGYVKNFNTYSPLLFATLFISVIFLFNLLDLARKREGVRLLKILFIFLIGTISSLVIWFLVLILLGVLGGGAGRYYLYLIILVPTLILSIVAIVAQRTFWRIVIGQILPHEQRRFMIVGLLVGVYIFALPYLYYIAAGSPYLG